MPFYSASIATLLVFVLGYLALCGAFVKSPLLMTAVALYTIILIAAGWIYIFTGRRVAAWIHAVLMFGVAIVGGYVGFGAVGFNSDARGPDASPLGAIVVIVGLLITVIAIGMAVCAIGVVRHILREDEDSSPSA
jgi:hypothetical protein